MRLALLMGNRFNPWHLKPFALLPGNPQVVCFRAESEIQRYFDERDDGSIEFPTERILFETQARNPVRRMWNVLRCRCLQKEPRILPFADRLSGFDILQTWELFTDWTEQALDARDRYKNKVVVMVWDNIPFNMEHPEHLRHRKARCIQSADLFLVYSERSRLMLFLEGVPPDRIARINPGVDTELFCPAPSDRAAFNIPDHAVVLLFVGWFLPRKGLEFLLSATHLLRNDPVLNNRPLRLLVVGSGPGRGRVESLVGRLGLGEECVFLGSRPYHKMPDVFRIADVFVFPSVPTPQWQEQFGMAMLEAMSCGIPVVASMSGSIPEIAGDAAVFCQPADVISLRDALHNVLSDPEKRATMAARGRQRVEQQFDVRQSALGLAEAYARLLG